MTVIFYPGQDFLNILLVSDSDARLNTAHVYIEDGPVNLIHALPEQVNALKPDGTLSYFDEICS